jgi:BirA family biotin operon repressor/biotin-[acetyl-CoA-carboxylase] ligase
VEGTRQQLLQCLSRPGFRSGTEMGAALGLSRAAVHKHVQALVERGVPIHSVPGRGYRLAEGVTLLDEALIKRRMTSEARALVSALDILDEVDSTSGYLAGLAGPDQAGRICLTEAQTAGRGRRGRTWTASPYRDLMMSIGIEYPGWPAQLPTLGLVAALMVARALADLGAADLRLKWPNDVVHGDHKLCGILLDVTGEAHGPCRVIVGIGINVSMDPGRGRTIDREWTDLGSILDRVPDRNTLAATCLNHLLPVFRDFPAEGFSPRLTEWQRLDSLLGRGITVHAADGRITHGEARGVDESGRLRVLEETGDIRLLTQGDVSVRVR